MVSHVWFFLAFDGSCYTKRKITSCCRGFLQLIWQKKMTEWGRVSNIIMIIYLVNNDNDDGSSLVFGNIWHFCCWFLFSSAFESILGFRYTFGSYLDLRSTFWLVSEPGTLLFDQVLNIRSTFWLYLDYFI